MIMNIDDVMRLVRNNIKSLAPYSTARDEYKGALGVFLDANENPFDNGFNRYPDPRQSELKARIADLRQAQICPSCGGSCGKEDKFCRKCGAQL